MSTSTEDLLVLFNESTGRRTIDVKHDGDDLVFVHPRAPEKAQRISLERLKQALAESGAEARSWVASFLEGVTADIKPDLKRSISDLSFVDAAGRLVVRLEGPGFEAGVEHASGETAWTREWQQGLVLSFWVEFDQGVELLRERDVENWGCSDDRVWCAARSVLHHKSRNRNEQVTDSVEHYSVGDGYDSARVIVVEDLEWQRSSGGLWVGVPSDGELLFRVPAENGAALDEFRALVKRSWDDANYPLSPRVFHLKRGQVSSLPA